MTVDKTNFRFVKIVTWKNKWAEISKEFFNEIKLKVGDYE